MKLQANAIFVLGIAQAALLLVQPTAAFSKDKPVTFRYTCVSPNGQSLLIENGTKHNPGHVYQVNLSKTWLNVCLAKGKQASLTWDTYNATPSQLSQKDPNDIFAHYVTTELLAICDHDRYPNLMATSMLYSDSCYHDIEHDIRIDVANPLNSELTMRNTFNEVSSTTPLSCHAGYTNESVALMEKAAAKNFPRDCQGVQAPRKQAGQVLADEFGTKFVARSAQDSVMKGSERGKISIK